MLKINWMPGSSETYAKGTDDDGNKYYYSPEKNLYLCFTTSGSIGAGRTTKEALEYARYNELKPTMDAAV